MVKWRLLLREVAIVFAVVFVAGSYWYSLPAPSTPYADGCTTIVCDGQKADENEQPDVTAPVTQAPNTTLMENNSAANPTEAAPTPPKETVSRTPIRRHRTRPRATIRTRHPAGNDPFCSEMPAIAYSMSRETIIRAARARGYNEQQIQRALACLGK
jgi:hypothetical protein